MKSFKDQLDQLHAEKQAKDAQTFNLAHEIVMAHGDMEHSHVPGSDTHEFSAYHGSPHHVVAAMNSLKELGWHHPDNSFGHGEPQVDEYELHHPDTTYKFNYYPQSIQGRHQSQLTVTGGPKERMSGWYHSDADR